MLWRLKIFKQLTQSSLFLLITAGLFSSCTISTPAADTPLPEQQNIEKAFFVDPSGHHKTFLCGWAAENEVGTVAAQAVGHNVPIATHCNLEFEITENSLVGKRVNPSFPNDRSRWAEIVTIPISKHYYYEKAKDENGRDRNAFIENDSRSHWSARPFMKLNLAHMQIHDWAYALPGSGAVQVLSVDDIEWDAKNHFLGFTVVTNDDVFGSENQGRYRINFSEFTHNPGFKITPFNDKNYSLINVLHIVGEKADGIYPILHAAHWDLTKVHDVYLNDFPDEYVGIAEDIVKNWNTTLVSIHAMSQADVDAGKAGFRINKTKNKHAFDLRYPSITWVSDMKISLAPSSPLGIAMSQADVQNGELLWGGITLYGGIIEHYIKSYASVAGVMPVTTSSNILKFAGSIVSKLTSNFIPAIPDGMDPGFMNVQRVARRLPEVQVKASKDATAKNSVASSSGLSLADPSSKEIMSLFHKSHEVSAKVKAQFSQEGFQDFLSERLFSQKLVNHVQIDKAAKTTPAEHMKKVNPLSNQDLIQNLTNSSAICADRTFADVAPGWVQGIRESKREYHDVLRSMIKELIIHEFGHFIGLGHQFKENILPERGTVPDSIYEGLAKKATAKEGYTQMTSVMGYRHPRSEMRTTYEDVVPGPHDRLVLAYLYTQKYSTFKKGDADFTFVDLPKDGVIPPADQTSTIAKTSYFPQCNDITASLSLDPYCNRFDRGHNATEIVENYFADINDNLEQSYFAFTDSKGANPESNEAYLWRKNFSTMGRIRMFYDFMRKKYRDEIDSISQDETALYDFSNACKTGQSSNQKLLNVFESKPEFKELCQVNANVVDEIRNLATKQLSEYTKVDQSSAYLPAGITGGDVDSDWGHALGSWTQMSSAPLKVPAIYALIAPTPWVALEGDLLTTVATYQREDSGFSYSTLYPSEYTSAIAYAVRDNLKFTNLNGHDEGNRLGRVILAIGGLSSSVHNNERHTFPEHYLDNLLAQSKFELSVVAIKIEAVGTNDDPLNSVDRFQGIVADAYGDYVPVKEIYLLPNREVIVRANDMFLFPVTKLELEDDRHFFVLAYKLSYSHEYGDILSSKSVKTQLQTLHDQVLSSCLDGNNNNGVAQYFKKGNPKFSGFSMLPGVMASPESQDKFDKSVQDEFKKFYSENHLDPKACSEAIGGLGLIMSSAAIIDGGWLPEASKYLLNSF